MGGEPREYIRVSEFEHRFVELEARSYAELPDWADPHYASIAHLRKWMGGSPNQLSTVLVADRQMHDFRLDDLQPGVSWMDEC